MEFLALIIINLVIAVILYYVILIKVSGSVKDYQNQKLIREAEAHIQELYQESDNYLNLLDSRIVIIRNLINRLEKLESVKKNGKSIPDEKVPEMKPERKEPPAPLPEKNDIIAEGVTSAYVKNEIFQDFKKEKSEASSNMSGIFAGLGKGLKSVFGINEMKMPEMNVVPEIETRSSLDYTVSGNPFETREKVRDNNSPEQDFSEIMAKVNQVKSGRRDAVVLSLEGALADLPEGSSKIDKVVHLVKKGFTAQEIAGELGLAVPEVELIKTFRMDKQ